MHRETSRAAWAAVVLVLLFVVVQCGAGKPRVLWPPKADPTFGGLYPYDFADHGLENVKRIKSMLASGSFDRKKEDLYIFAFARGLLDAVLYASLLQPAEQKDFLTELGRLLDAGDWTSMDDVAQNKGLLKEPFFVLAKKHPSSPFAASVVEFDRILSILTDAQPTWLAVEPTFNFSPAGKRLSLTPQRDAAYATIILDVLEAASAARQSERMAIVLRGLLPYAFPNPEIGTNPDAIFQEKNIQKFVFRLLKPAASKIHEEPDPFAFAMKIVLEWMHGKLDAAMNGDDPLVAETKITLFKRAKALRSLPFSSQSALTKALPRLEGEDDIRAPVFYPFTFITLSAGGEMRVATEPVLDTAPDGTARMLNAKSSFLWPGKKLAGNIASLTEAEAEALLGALETAEKNVESLVADDAYGNVRQGRVVALAADRDLPAHKLPPLLDVLRKRYDSVLMAALAGDHLALIPVWIRPNCPGEGTKVTISLLDGSIRLVDSSGEEIQEKDLGDPLGTSPVKPDVLSGILTSFADLSKRPVHVETSYEGGSWTWGDLVAIHVEAARITQGETAGEAYITLMPGITMEQTAGMEGKDPALPADPSAGSMEDLILKGLYGGFDEDELDAALSSFITPMKLEDAATVILNAARCWGGDYRVRAADALAKADAPILKHVADYIGDETLNDVVSGALSAAGKPAAPFVVGKLRSSEEVIWNGAWYILVSMPFADTKEAIVGLLSDPNPEIRVRALKILSQVGPAGGVPEILKLIDDEDEFVRRWAIVDAGMLGMSEAEDKLRAILEKKTTDAGLLADAIFALGLLEVQASVGPIIDYAKHADPAVRAAAALALGNMDMSGEDVKATVASLLEDKDPAVRAAAVHALSVGGDPEAAALIEPLLDDPSTDVQKAASEALAALGATPEEETGVDLSTIADTCLELAPDQILAIATAEGDEVFACLVKLSKVKTPEVRMAAVEALGLRGDKKAEAALLKRTKDKLKDIRKAAWEALKKLGLSTLKKKGGQP